MSFRLLIVPRPTEVWRAITLQTDPHGILYGEVIIILTGKTKKDEYYS